LSDAVKKSLKSLPTTPQEVVSATRQALPGLHFEPPPSFVSRGSEYDKLNAAIDRYRSATSAANGGQLLLTDAVKEFRDTVSTVLNQSTDKNVLALGESYLKATNASNELSNKTRQLNADLNILHGTASKTDKQIAGIAGSTKEASKGFEEAAHRVRDEITEFQLQAATADVSKFAVQGLRKEHELMRAALRAGLAQVARPSSESSVGGTPVPREISTTWNARNSWNCMSTELNVSA
jgi:hypothetical protein